MAEEILEQSHWVLFIDDERNPVNKDSVIARSSQQAIDMVLQRGMPNHIDFDHDLGGQDTSRRFIWWLFDWMIENGKSFPKDFTWAVHSQNPVGAEWIRSTMRGLVSEIHE